MLPLLGAMRNKEAAKAPVKFVMLLPLLGAMRNPR